MILYMVCRIEPDAIQRYILISTTHITSGKIQYHTQPGFSVLTVICIKTAPVQHVAAIPAHCRQFPVQGEIIDQHPAKTFQRFAGRFFLRPVVHIPGQLFDGLRYLIIFQLFLPGISGRIFHLHRMYQTDTSLLRQGELFLILRIEGAVLHIPETALQTMILIHSPDQSHGKLVHNGIADKQLFPSPDFPLPSCGQRQLQPGFLAGQRGFHLFLHLFKGFIGCFGRLLLIPFARRRHIFQPLSCLIRDLHFQRRCDGHRKFALPIIKYPLHLMVKT